MRVRVHGPWPREIDLSGPLLVEDVLAALRLNPDAAIVVREDVVLSQESSVASEDTVDVICVVEGGSAL